MSNEIELKSSSRKNSPRVFLLLIEFRLIDQDKTSIWRECRVVNTILFGRYTDKQRPAASPVFSYVKWSKGDRERERGERDPSLHSERNIFFFSFFIDLLFFSFFLLKPPHRSAVLFVFSLSRTHTSNIALFIVVFYLLLIFHPSNHLLRTILE